MTGWTSPHWAAVVVIGGGVLGLLIGSFVNVLVYRVPAGMSIVRPASACPRCASPIKPHDNVPVLSWLALRGACRDCGEAISLRYPLVEAGVGVFFALVVLWGLGTGSGILDLVAYLYLAAISVALALIDLDTHMLPNAIVLPGYLVGAVLLGAAALIEGDWPALLRAGIGMAALFAAYFLMAIAYPGGMGFGDVKLAGVLGLFLGFLGWGHLAVGAFAAFLLGGLFAAGLMLAGRARRGSGIPFGPWMLAGAWVGILAGNAVWGGYLSLLQVA